MLGLLGLVDRLQKTKAFTIYRNRRKLRVTVTADTVCAFVHGPGGEIRQGRASCPHIHLPSQAGWKELWNMGVYDVTRPIGATR